MSEFRPDNFVDNDPDEDYYGSSVAELEGKVDNLAKLMRNSENRIFNRLKSLFEQVKSCCYVYFDSFHGIGRVTASPVTGSLQLKEFCRL